MGGNKEEKGLEQAGWSSEPSGSCWENSNNNKENS